MNSRKLVATALTCSMLLFACGEEPASAAESTPNAPDAAGPEGGATFQGCPADGPTFAIHEPVLGEAELLTATVLEASPVPPAKYSNVWTLEIGDPTGEPLTGATVDFVETFMPLHGHPGTPAATVDPLAEPARFAAVVHFFMRGLWEVRVDARSGPLTDRIVFHVCIED